MEDKLLSLLESVLGKGIPTSKNNYAFFSPFKDHYKRKLEIDLKINSNGLNLWHCWISDEKGKTIASLFKKLKVDKATWDQLNAIYRGYLKGKTVEEILESSTVSSTVSSTPNLTLPSEFIPIWKPSSSIQRRHAILYLKRRGIRQMDMIKYEIGFCETGEYKDRIIIPSFDANGQLNYFIARAFYKSEFLSYKLPPVSKNVIIFDLFINWNIPVTICEGVFDAFAIRQNAIPVLGKNPSSILKQKIIQKKPPCVNIVLDSDAFDSSLKFGEYLLKEGIPVKVIKLKDGDPSDIGFEKIKKLIQDTKLLSFSSFIKNKLHYV